MIYKIFFHKLVLYMTTLALTGILSLIRAMLGQREQLSGGYAPTAADLAEIRRHLLMFEGVADSKGNGKGKFWRIFLDGNSHATEYGPLFDLALVNPPRFTRKTFPTAAAALADADALIRKKRKKYIEINSLSAEERYVRGLSDIH